MAAMEGYEDTWANHYKPFIRAYAADGVSPLTAPELRDDVSRVWRYFVGCYWALTTVRWGLRVRRGEAERLAAGVTELQRRAANAGAAMPCWALPSPPCLMQVGNFISNLSPCRLRPWGLETWCVCCCCPVDGRRRRCPRAGVSNFLLVPTL